MVPSVSCATDRPTTVDSVNIEFTSRSPRNPGCCPAHAASRCSDWVFMVSVVNSTLSASVTERPGRCRYVVPISYSSNHRTRCSTVLLMPRPFRCPGSPRRAGISRRDTPSWRRRIPSRATSSSQPQRSCDQHQLDFGGALADLQDLAVAVVPSDRVFVDEAVHAMDLGGITRV